MSLGGGCVRVVRFGMLLDSPPFGKPVGMLRQEVFLQIFVKRVFIETKVQVKSK